MALDLYTSEIYNFLRSVTIKHSFIANRIKDQTMLNNGLAYLNDEDNPYYLNMCGEYSPYNTLMYVNSVETGQQVLFSKNLSNTNPTTLERYRLPSIKLDDLCMQYPTQKHLAESIIYPVDSIDFAIEAEDFTILKYDQSLLQKNELPSMLQCMIDTVTEFKNIWYVEAFLYADTYPMLLWSSLWQILFLNLYLQRIKNIRTPEVHVEHIWNYLTSNGLKDYRTVLSINQQYWLYKNIDYLTRNRGKNSNLQLLSDNLLNTYNVVLKQKSIMLNYGDGIENPLAIPEIISEDVNANTPPLENTASSYESIASIIRREVDNNLRQTGTLDDIQNTDDFFSKNTSTYHPTRIIEIDKKTMWLEYQSLYTRFIIQNYIYKYSKGCLDYNIRFSFNNSTNSKTLDVGKALALFNYCIHIELNLSNPESLDALIDMRIPSSMAADTIFKDCLNITNAKMTYNGIKYTYIERMLPELLNMNSSMSHQSPFDAMKYLDSKFQIIYNTSIYQRSLSDGLLNEAIEHTYQPYLLTGSLPINLVPGYATYREWFEEDPDLVNLTNSLKGNTQIESEEFISDLADIIFPSSIDRDIVNNGNVLDSKYLKLKELFVSLCSYTVGFLETTKDSYLNVPLHGKYVDSSSDIDNEMNIVRNTDIGVGARIFNTIPIDDMSYLDGSVTVRSCVTIENATPTVNCFNDVNSQVTNVITPSEIKVTGEGMTNYSMHVSFSNILAHSAVPTGATGVKWYIEHSNEILNDYALNTNMSDDDINTIVDI